jgi:hypothetical protein
MSSFHLSVLSKQTIPLLRNVKRNAVIPAAVLQLLNIFAEAFSLQVSNAPHKFIRINRKESGTV